MVILLKRGLFSLLLGLSCLAGAQENLRVVFVETSPPYSYLVQEYAVEGLFPELVTALFEGTRFALEVKSAPWARAQLQVESGEADLFLTYPSAKRQTYASFATVPLFVEDIGFLLYLPTNPNAAVLSKARSFADLQGLLMLGNAVSEWENDNVPLDIERESIGDDESRLNVLIARHHGDFVIMGLEQAKYYTDKLGYPGRLAHAKVNFIPDAQVTFNLGVSKKYPDHAALLAFINARQSDPAVQARLASIRARYALAK